MLYAFDIETTGLNPEEDRVVSLAVATETESVVFDSAVEETLFDDILSWFTNPRRPGGVIVTWNGCAFDWPFLSTRAHLLGHVEFLDAVTMLPTEHRKAPYKPLTGHCGGYAVQFAGHDHADIMRAWKSWSSARGTSNALKVVAREHGIDVIEVDRERIVELPRHELVAYNISDVDATLTLAVTLGKDISNWLDSSLFVSTA